MIKVFSKEGCPFCEDAKALLTRHGYEYEEVRIDLDEDARQFLLDEGHRTVPQLYFNNTLMVEGGFDGLKELTTKQLALRIREIGN